jgi:hypothetical protein
MFEHTYYGAKRVKHFIGGMLVPGMMDRDTVEVDH